MWRRSPAEELTAPRSSGGVLRTTVVFLVIALMVLLVVLALQSILRLSSSDSAENDPDAAVAAALEGQPDTVELVGAQGPTTVSCGRPSDTEPFVVVVDDPAPGSGDVAVGLDLVDPSGQRHRRVVTLPAVLDGTSRSGEVPDSSDPARYLSCVITAVQRDQQLTLTGR